MEHPLTEKMIKRGTRRLQEFRRELWDEERGNIGFLLPVVFLPDARIKNVLDNFADINTTKDLFPYIHDLWLLSGHEGRLFGPEDKKAAPREPAIDQACSLPTIASSSAPSALTLDQGSSVC
ncbi:hypothetical protein BDZ97DRAFT_1916416 [Flammula alnicola]|nr:hypothetical protein BDZ97DRAFT_1916416 [Flammula alnicola]